MLALSFAAADAGKHEARASAITKQCKFDTRRTNILTYHSPRGRTIEGRSHALQGSDHFDGNTQISAQSAADASNWTHDKVSAGQRAFAFGKAHISNRRERAGTKVFRQLRHRHVHVFSQHGERP